MADASGEADVDHHDLDDLVSARWCDALVHHSPDVKVWHEPSRDLWIAGDLFRGNGPLTQLSSGLCDAVLDTDGKFLIEQLWGRYIAFWRHPRTGAIRVCRDPSGAPPLYHARVANGHLLFTHLPLALAAGLGTPRIDWDGIAHQLRYRDLPTQRTGILGVDELLPGARIAFERTQPERLQLWSPLAFTKQKEPEDPPSAVRAAVINSTAALARDKGALLLELSGGLDSSIVASALSCAGADWRAATSVTPGADGDERHYAKLVADRFEVVLQDVLLRTSAVDFLTPPRVLRLRPSGYSMLAAIDSAYDAAAHACGAHALVSGTGGDNVFCYLRSAAPVADRMSRNGWRMIWSTAGEVAMLTGTDRWRVFQSGLRYRLRHYRFPHRWLEDTQFLGSCRPAPAPHPWLDNPQTVRPGARAHVALILRARAVLDALDRSQARVMLFPLLAQPVVETCLSIPSWNWVEGGRDRAVARQAFRSDLPPAIIERRAKGRIESLLLPRYAEQRDALIELLLDGRLAKLGIVDRSSLEAARARPVVADDPSYFRILELVDAELWATTLESLCSPS